MNICSLLHISEKRTRNSEGCLVPAHIANNLVSLFASYNIPIFIAFRVFFPFFFFLSLKISTSISEDKLRMGNKQNHISKPKEKKTTQEIQYFTGLDQDYIWQRKNAPTRISSTDNWITEQNYRILSPFRLFSILNC